ncbi:hypothetical protein M758_3G199700 [Ceratodon purpureus]|nr:hypothetical protein M758_3G199700 [Ceratodon purpureus]
MMAQDFQQYGLLSEGLVPQLDSSNYGMSRSRGLWCYGIQSDVAKEWSFQLNKNGMPAAESKLASEASIEGGQVVVRSQSCPWSTMNVNSTNQIAATDLIYFQSIIDDALPPGTCRRPGGHDQGWCKYCATLEKELTYSLEMKEKWADENSWADVSFKPVDQYFESRTSTSLADQYSRKRKYGVDDWENDRSLVLLKLNELNTRTTRAEQRVVELEQLLRDHALVALDGTCEEADSDIVTSTIRHDYFNEGQSEMLVCKIAGCNKSFKSSKTLRRHVLQKHSDNARFLVCNQPTVNGLMCRFETIHSGVLSYHRKYSLAHQRREDWHISCPFCQSKFARQHEMERHRRICKSQPAPRVLANSIGSVQNMTVTGTTSALSDGLNHLNQMPGSSFVVPERGHNHIFSMPESIIESSITY